MFNFRHQNPFAMKKLLSSILCLLSFSLLAQDYQLFKSGSNVVFTDSVKAFSVAFDSVKLQNSDSIYYNFSTVRDTFSNFNTDTCQFWGQDWAIIQDKATWLGAEVKDGNNGRYSFITLLKDTLNFDFNVNTTDSTLIFKDATQKFYLKYIKEQEGTVLNYTDELRHYEVIHTDSSGLRLNSELQGSEVIIGKELGLVQFFQIDQFPEILNPVYLLGHSKLDLGLYEITEADVYDYQIGDEIQYSKYVYDDFQNFQENYHYFEKFEILSRVDGSDSVLYQAERTIYSRDFNTSVTDNVRLSYSKNKIIQKLPFEIYDANRRSLSYQNYDGINLWNYKIQPDLSLFYCELENCWGTYDTGGPLADYENNYTLGVGPSWWSFYIRGGDGSISRGERIGYFKKNGNVWGKEVVLGIKESFQNMKLTISPNPMANRATIRTTEMLNNASLMVTDLTGRNVLQVEGIIGNSINLRTSNLPNGFYLLQLIQNNRTIGLDKFVVQHK
jgi:hypothetical protein